MHNKFFSYFGSENILKDDTSDYDTTEVLIILSGSLKVDFYSHEKKYLFSNILKKNDIIILLTAGHGFKVLEKCKFIEVKQGPYNPKLDKFKF